MCMISKEIKAVASTQLFCGVNKEKTKQITIYANTVDNVIKNNAMVLPVPFPTSVVFHNLEKYKDFFSDCQNSFYDANNSTYSLSTNSAISGVDPLVIFNIWVTVCSLSPGLIRSGEYPQ